MTVMGSLAILVANIGLHLVFTRVSRLPWVLGQLGFPVGDDTSIAFRLAEVDVR